MNAPDVVGKPHTSSNISKRKMAELRAMQRRLVLKGNYTDPVDVKREQERLYWREWAKRNRDKLRAIRARSREKNKARSKAWREKNRGRYNELSRLHYAKSLHRQHYLKAYYLKKKGIQYTIPIVRKINWMALAG